MLNLTLSCRFVQFRLTRPKENIFVINQPAMPLPKHLFLLHISVAQLPITLKSL